MLKRFCYKFCADFFGIDFTDSNRCQRLTFVEHKSHTLNLQLNLTIGPNEKNTCEKDSFELLGYHFCQWANGSTFTFGSKDINLTS